MTGSERGWLQDLLVGRRNRGPIPRRARGWGGSRGLEALETRWLMAVFVPPKVVEGGSVRNTADFVIRLERPGPKPLTYSFTTGGGIATPGADYVAAEGTVTFEPGETTKVVAVEIIDDNLIEHDEDFYLAVKGPGRPFFGRAIIIDDDTPGPPVHVSNPIVPEGEGPIPASRVRFLSPSRIRRMARDYQVGIARL
jgi:Calx-beta domain